MCSLDTCSNISEHEGAIILTAQPPGAFIKNTEIANGAGHGITEGYDGSFIDLRPTNKLTSFAGCGQLGTLLDATTSSSGSAISSAKALVESSRVARQTASEPGAPRA